ncbi:MAG TPA: DUF4382 domain-containing protein, partial [Candidatus Micrarchaeota archaeon]|nr:DUF4382 domain-containing protein [Candidatus Micrarchaeota archaeon]
MDKKLLVIATAIVSMLLLGCTGSQPANSAGNGRVVLGITDAAADMGSVSSVMVTIDSVQVMSASQGWVTLSSTPKTYDLMKLKAEGSTALLADVQVPPGDYQQVRLHISQVTVTDSSGTHDAKLPSGDLKIVGGMNVAANATATATFDFIADQSLHTTGNGQYIMAPVIQVETRDNAQAEVAGDGKVTINGGRVRSSSRVGMDINGNVGEGLKIDSNLNLTIGTGGIITIGRPDNSGNPDASAKGRVVVGISDVAADMGSVSSVMVTIDSVQVMSASQGWVTLSSTPKT